MALCICLSHLKHTAKVNIINGSFRSYLNVLSKKSFLSSNAIRSLKTKSSKTGFKKLSKDPPQNVGVTFDSSPTQFSMSMLWKPFIFTTCFSAGTLAACAIWQYENGRKEAASRFKVANFWNRVSQQTTNKRFKWRQKLNRAFENLTEGEKLFFTICFLNVLVHLAWKVPKFETTMIRYFSSNPISRVTCLPLLFTTFSHYNTIHMVMNMYALHSFSTLAINALGKEQFLGLYLAGGVFSSFTSLFFRVMTKKTYISVGASGAILAVVGYISAKYPDLELSIIGLPMCTFTAQNAISALIMIDLTGLVLGWKFLDHAAHLGGACFGMFWHHWGNANIWQKRKPLLQWWHGIRNSME